MREAREVDCTQIEFLFTRLEFLKIQKLVDQSQEPPRILGSYRDFFIVGVSLGG